MKTNPIARHFLACLCLVASTVTLLSGAQALEQLSGKAITSFIGTLAPLEKIGEKYEDTDWQSSLSPENFSIVDAANPFSASLKHLNGHPAYPEFLAVIKKHGFASAESWAGTADRVIRAYMTTQMEQENPNMNLEMSEAMAAMKSNPNVTPEQLAMMEQLMKNSAGIFAAYRAPAEDVKAIKPYLPQIEKAVNR